VAVQEVAVCELPSVLWVDAVREIMATAWVGNKKLGRGIGARCD
jgi:hypothetical protein